MPKRAKIACKKTGCRKLVEVGDGYCEDHKSSGRAYDKDRGSAHERGYSSAWRKARAGYLAHHPLCVHCEANGRVVAATDVDHIIDHKGDKELFWDKNNWQPLCKTHHSRKTAISNGWGD